MKVSLTDAGKRFNRDWIFRHLTYTFEEGQSYAIVGPNGSGKSTLLQVISGAMQLNEGSISYEDGSKLSSAIQHPSLVDPEKIYSQTSICAPYLEVIEEMTMKEFLHFHHGFKPFLPELTVEKIIALLDLEKAFNKQIRYYSSGMKQRVRLAQAIFSDVPVVLLDEPCTNFDAAGISLYHQLINDYCKNRLLVVSSNDEVEYGFCNYRINITDFK